MQSIRQIAGLTLGAALLVGALGSACASKLPREVTDRTPGGMAELLDLSLVEFKDVHTGETVNLKAYMDETGRDFLLLTFGAEFCAACSDKGRHLVADVIGKHPLYLTDVASRFEIIGINTDQHPERLGQYLVNFPFVQWSDPAGPDQTMLRFFMPPGNKFKVPLTVMVSRRGIEWRIMPDERISMAAMMERVEYTLGLRAEPQPDGDGGDGGEDDGGDDGGDDGPARGDLDVPGPGRLKSVELVTCAGAATDLHAALGEASYRFVQVSRGGCDSVCLANAQTMTELMPECAGLGTTCAVASLTTSAPSAAACANGRTFKGGDAFFDVFATHFNWDDAREIDESTGLSRFVGEVQGPLILGFDAAGTLVFSKEGALASGELATAMAAPDFGATARGPDFPLYGRQAGTLAFADLRRQTKFTVVTAFGFMCSSCIEELKHWSEPGQLVDFCAARPTDCQLQALETGEPMPGQTAAAYLNGLQHGSDDFDGFDALHIRVPLLLDPLPKYLPDDSDNLARFFEGYLIATSPNPEWWGDPRTVIYDQEGKIVAQYRSETPPVGEDDPVLRKLKILLAP